ncbi:MAG: iron transporter [Simplicispira sp.]|nr:iron transporter [Simplicispira sp.]
MIFRSLVFSGLMGLSLTASALEYPIGAPHNVSGMEVGAVYLQPVEMEPEGHMRKVAESDIHLKPTFTLWRATPMDTPEGTWIPFLLVKYELSKQGSGAVIRGDMMPMMPMVASDGPHYGDNVKLAGPGKYRVKFTVYPPSAKENTMGMHYGRHTDRATGVRPWFKTVELEWDFTYAGVGKTGGY